METSAAGRLRVGGWALAALLAGCGGGGGGSPEAAPAPLPEPPPPQSDPAGIDKARLRQQVEVFVAEQKSRIASIDCSQSQTGPCELLRNLRFSEGQALPARLRADQTILLIDSGLEHAATLRYRARMLAYYRLSEVTGLVETHDPVIPSTPRWGAELLRAIDGFQYRDAAGQARPSHVPAAWLEPLRPLLKGERDFAMLDRVPHGNMVLSQLVEASPQAGFVLLDPFPFQSLLKAHRASVCAKDAVGLKQAAQRAAQSLGQVMQRHGVDYVNLSGGWFAEDLAITWVALNCSGSLSPDESNRLMLALRPLFAQLFESPAVLGVQSAGGAMSPLTHPLDVLELAQRVRVGYYHPLQAAPLPADGVLGGQRPAVEEPSAAERRWIDVFIGTGMSRPGFRPEFNTAPPVRTDSVYGLGLWPVDSSTTSWSAPQALNRLIHLKQQLAPTMAPEAPLDAALIQRMKTALTPPGCSWAPEDGGRCKLQDPAWHRQQEQFRQGWLPADWRWE